MKISSFFSRFGNPRGRAFFVASALIIKPFGPVPDLLKQENPWHGSENSGALLTMVRAQSVPLEGSTCASWVQALMDDAIGKSVRGAKPDDWKNVLPAWGPWRAEEIDSIENCDKFPCDVKFNEAETKSMALAKKPQRHAQFDSLVLDRIHRYQKTQERKEYEFPGDPIDPWKHFEAMGLKSPLKIPSKMELEARRVDFFPGKVKTIRQVFDTRIAENADETEATLWRRDVYSDHYFDSWGEWAQVGCDPKHVFVVEAAVLELDLMKKTDLFSKLMHSKMRGAVEDAGVAYLDRWFNKLKKKATISP